jgi:hypothetical protein
MFVPSERSMFVARRADSRWLGRRAAAAAVLVWLCFVLVHDSSALLRTPARELAPKHDGPVGTEALPRSALVLHNLTTFRLPSGQCVQRAVALPELSCSLPFCNSTRRRSKLFVLTNQRERKWASFLRFNLHALNLRDDARLVDLELRLLGTDRCHSKTINFTHQLHLLNAKQDPLSIPIDRPYPRRLTAQWSNQAFSSAFRVALNLNARQLAKVTRTRRLNFVLSEKLFGAAEQLPSKPLKRTCGYYSAAHTKPERWPRLQLSFSFPCCAKGGGGAGAEGGAGAKGEDEDEDEGEGGDEGEGEGGGGAAAKARRRQRDATRDATGDDRRPRPRPAWIDRTDWQRLPRWRRPAPVHFHSRLAATPPPWVLSSSVDGMVEGCTPPTSRAEAAGGQLAPPPGEAPVVSVIVAFHNNEDMTAACMEALFACASELPSAEYLFVDDGSDTVTGALPTLLRRLAAEYGLRFQLDRYRVCCAYMHMHMHVHAHVHVHMYMCMCMHMCMSLHMHNMCMSLHMHNMHMHMHMHMCMCMLYL